MVDVDKIKKLIMWVNNTGNNKSIGEVESFWKKKQDVDSMRLFINYIINDLNQLLPENLQNKIPKSAVPYQLTVEDMGLSNKNNN